MQYENALFGITTARENSPSYICPSTWNKLPESLKKISSSHTFKYGMRQSIDFPFFIISSMIFTMINVFITITTDTITITTDTFLNSVLLIS